MQLPVVAALGGVRGTVRDEGTQQPLPHCAVDVRSAILSSPHRPHVGHHFGDFYRPVAPGTYDVVAECAG